MILFDHKIFFLQKYGGISRYIIELCKQLSKNNKEYFIQATIHKNIYLRNFLISKKRSIYLNSYPRFTRKIFSKINAYNLKKKVNMNNYKILHNTYYGNYRFKKKINQILSVYDFTHEKFSKKYNYKYNYKYKAIENSNHYICISNNTKKDLIKYYNIDENNISVIHLGGNHLPSSNLQFNNTPYVLYVGARNNYKKFETLLEAFYISKKIKNDFSIICFGDEPFNSIEKEKILKFKLSNIVKHVTGDDQMLANLYNSASCHVITSEYEGFGVTAVEAYNFNCPVIYNYNSSLKEIGCISSSFDGSSSNLEYVLEKVLYSNDVKSKIISESKILKDNFNWENCFKATNNLYNKFLY